MQEATVPHEYLGRLDLSLAEILKPRPQLANHEDACQKIEIAAHRRFADGERPGQFGAIPGLGVVVG